MVHGANEYYYKAMDKEKTYYFTIEAINENGVSERMPAIKAE
jgi:xylan 1,4-beta-xylosidase